MIRDRHQGVVVFPGAKNSWSPTKGAAQATAKSVVANEALALKQFGDEGLSHRHQHVDARGVLAELVELLEDYAPVWFTHEHRERVQIALRTLKDN